ncbi:hypothetical protein V500_08887 [Pseudogymnoascus sp. VKM F-4518 (FW-2643)]|nr:hypothetical protein V500_08887 [Pseudogymnoascus sp. VKM F-4518 (FW-2643)]
MGILTRKFNPEQDSELFDTETGNCSIEYYNACKDVYRVAPNNKIPVPWPWSVEKASDSSEEVFDRLEERVREVLECYGIITHYIGVHSVAERYTPQKSKDTIIIKTRDEPRVSWKEAASKIYYEIVEPAATSAQIQMRVEIRNEEKMYKDVVHVIRDHDPVEALQRIQPLILNATKEFCPGKWSSIGIHNRGHAPRDSEKKITVTVSIRPGSVDAWGAFEEKIVRVIESAIPLGEVDIAVEILPGQIIPL